MTSTAPINWLHDGRVAHAIRRTDFDRYTAWCGFTFLPARSFQQLTPTSVPCSQCGRARLEADEPHVWGEG